MFSWLEIELLFNLLFYTISPKGLSFDHVHIFARLNIIIEIEN